MAQGRVQQVQPATVTSNPRREGEWPCLEVALGRELPSGKGRSTIPSLMVPMAPVQSGTELVSDVGIACDLRQLEFPGPSAIRLLPQSPMGGSRTRTSSRRHIEDRIPSVLAVGGSLTSHSGCGCERPYQYHAFYGD